MTQPAPRNRGFRTFMYLDVDRVPDDEFGCWPQTVRAWVAEGFPKDWADEIGDGTRGPFPSPPMIPSISERFRRTGRLCILPSESA